VLLELVWRDENLAAYMADYRSKYALERRSTQMAGQMLSDGSDTDTMACP